MIICILREGCGKGNLVLPLLKAERRLLFERAFKQDEHDNERAYHHIRIERYAVGIYGNRSHKSVHGGLPYKGYGKGYAECRSRQCGIACTEDAQDNRIGG